MIIRYMVAMVMTLSITSCAMTPIIQPINKQIMTNNSIYVEFVPDRLNLTEVFYKGLAENGYKTTKNKYEAYYLLTGNYHGYFDLFHNKIKHGRLIIKDMKTGNEVLLIDVGDSGLTSAESQVLYVISELNSYRKL